MKAYSIDLKKRAVDYYRTHMVTLRATSAIFSISISSLGKWANNIHMESRYRGYTSKMEQVDVTLRKLVKEDPMITLKQIKRGIGEIDKVTLSTSSLWRYLRKMKYTMKKARKITKTDKNTEEIKRVFRQKINNRGIHNIYTLDEVGFQLEMRARRGWSLKGTRCNYTSTERGHKNYSGVFLISSKGIVDWQLHKNAIDGSKFTHFLKGLNSSLVVDKTLVMDNLRTHHMREVKEILDGHKMDVMYMPPYSPDLNPIEEMFSMMKRSLRHTVIRTEAELVKELNILVAIINNKGLYNYFNHAYNIDTVRSNS